MERRKADRTAAAAAAGAALTAVSWGLLAAARKADGFSEWYAGCVYPVLTGSLGRLSGLFPFSVVELGLYIVIVYAAFMPIRFRKRPAAAAVRIFCFCALLFFLYTVNCGINYYRKPFSSWLNLETGKAGDQELYEMCSWLTDMVNTSRKEMEQDSGSWKNQGEKGTVSMNMLGETYPVLSGFYPQPKPVTVSWILSIQQCSGVYSPFTIEANYNRDMTAYNIPHTICHELSHLRGFMREDEANFIGYLACIDAPYPDFRYSGYFMGWIYAGNALAGTDPEAYRELYAMLDESVREDLEENSRFWNRYEGKTAEVANRVNDAYLKANGQQEGVRTYGRAVDLMLADFLENRGDFPCNQNEEMVK